MKHMEMFRRANEQYLNLGDVVPIKDGLKGVVLARFTPSVRPGEVGYLLDPQIDATRHKIDKPQVVAGE